VYLVFTRSLPEATRSYKSSIVSNPRAAFFLPSHQFQKGKSPKVIAWGFLFARLRVIEYNTCCEHKGYLSIVFNMVSYNCQ
jgi:hypothetical protein